MNDNLITNEMLADAENCIHFESCKECKMPSSQIYICIEAISKALVIEREEREAMQDVWKDAPENCDYIASDFYHKNGQGISLLVTKNYTRTLPKTRARMEAEKTAKDILFSKSPIGENQLADRIESALLEYGESK